MQGKQPQQQQKSPAKPVNTAKKVPNNAKKGNKKGGRSGIGKFFIGLLIGLLAPVIALSVFIVVNGGNLWTFVKDFDFETIAEPILDIAEGEMASEPELELTIELYDRLKTGMSYKEVTNIIGAKGSVERKSGNKVEYIWKDSADDSAIITAVFAGNKMSSKSQKGLT